MCSNKELRQTANFSGRKRTDSINPQAMSPINTSIHTTTEDKNWFYNHVNLKIVRFLHQQSRATRRPKTITDIRNDINSINRHNAQRNQNKHCAAGTQRVAS